MLSFDTIALTVSFYVYGLRSCLTLMALGWWYNDYDGAENCGTRKLMNVGGYLSFMYGAFEVAIGSPANSN